ncbi:MAG: hypothetical protein P8J75_09275 [Actinomycetota bacterium]|nr:hypothetical protein [Actinomycetota bacterium]
MGHDEYVEVRDEPRHRHRFENDYIRLYDVLIPEGDQTLYHRHCVDTFYVMIADSSVQDRTLGELESSTAQIIAGGAFLRAHLSEPLIHRVCNIGSSDARMIGAELKAAPPVSASLPLDVPCHSVQKEHDRLRVYRLGIQPEQTTGPISYDFYSLTIVLEAAVVLVEDELHNQTLMSCSAGDAIWQSPRSNFTISNPGRTEYRAIVAEWREQS